MTATAVAPEKPATLDEIGLLFQRLDAALIESEGDVTPEVEAVLELHANLEKWKLDAYAFRIKALLGQAVATKALAAELATKARREEAQADWLKARLKAYLESRNETKLPGNIYEFCIQRNGQASLDLLLGEDVILALLPTFAKEPQLDKAKLREAVTADPTMYDAVAVLTTGSHLRIG